MGLGCNKTIQVGERIYRHAATVLCTECHNRTAAPLVPYTTAEAITEVQCGTWAETYNQNARRRWLNEHPEADHHTVPPSHSMPQHVGIRKP
jgi:hypothetical protein